MWPLAFLLIFADPYEALRARQYDVAVSRFEEAIAAAPKNASLRKDLAYTLLKIGENEAARDQFGEAMRLAPNDQAAATEYAFLCFEAGRKPEARRIFQRIDTPVARAAFHNIDDPLASGIQRWTKAVQLSPGNFSAHEELARLADQRDDFPLAAEHFEHAWRLKPSERSLLLDLGRTWKSLGRLEDSNAALLAASRGAQPRVAEQAREISPKRYPYVYEFRRALQLDPPNLDLRRELAYQFFAMGEKESAETEFRTIMGGAPDDLLSVAQLGFLLLQRNDPTAKAFLNRVIESGDEELADRARAALKLPQTFRRRAESTQQKVSREAKTMAASSLQAGYLEDAKKYLAIAHESDPLDFSVMLQLGWTFNILKHDNDAVKWFNLARHSPDTAVSEEADHAYRNLAPGLRRTQTTAWLYPMYSSRWHDVFSYAQIKTAFRLARLPLRPYVSTRFIGDTRGTLDSSQAGVAPQYLSESSVIFALGVATASYKGATAWFEAGESLRYRGEAAGHITPDYRGGVSFSRGIGHPMRSDSHGLFADSSDDGIYVSRFDHDFLLYSQNRAGYTLRSLETGGFQAQLYLNANVTLDTKRQYWANYFETGPGLRFRFDALPPSLFFTINAVRGNYLVQTGNLRGPTFYDLRIGFWYAFTH